jgi:hypothetical protein
LTHKANTGREVGRRNFEEILSANVIFDSIKVMCKMNNNNDWKFMRITSCFFTLGIASVLMSSCGTTNGPNAQNLSKGESFAVASCGLSIVADSEDGNSEGDSNGQKWSTPALETEGSWGIDSPINEIIALRDELNDASVSASAAAQEDSSFMSLAESTSSMASFVSQVVISLQNEPWNKTNPLFYETYYNTGKKTRVSECAGLSLRLNAKSE